MKQNRAELKDDIFMAAAVEFSKLATCNRKHVGAVLVKHGEVISTGYNGAPDGMPHCLDEGCLVENDHCVRTIHAEANAIYQAGVRNTAGATLYTTASPCWLCFLAIVRAKIKRIVFKEIYRDERIFKFAQEVGIQLDFFRTCCPWHRHNPGPKYTTQRMKDPELCRCLDDDNCSSCWLESHGCGCDGSMDDGCFLCTPEKHKRPPCPTLQAP